jgi:DNA-binding response OmpR family regulator
VLIVEDDAALLRGLKDNFQAQGYQVRTATDGETGLEAFLRDPPDLALLDVMLPKVNGYEICRLVRSRRLGTRILMLSAKNRVDDVLRGSAVGADDYMTKPFGIRELLARARGLSGRGTPAGATGRDRQFRAVAVEVDECFVPPHPSPLPWGEGGTRERAETGPASRQIDSGGTCAMRPPPVQVKAPAHAAGAGCAGSVQDTTRETIL